MNIDDHKKFLVIASFAFLLICILHAYATGLLLFPPEPGDAHDYDNIAWHIVAGDGFGHGWKDSEFQAPYLSSPLSGYYQSIFQERQGEFYLTGYRPPGYPLLLALIYKTIGRSFLAARLVNIALVTISFFLMARYLSKTVGAAAGTLFCFLSLCDPILTTLAATIMTEPAAIFLMTLCFLFLTAYFTKPTLWRAICIGATLGVGLLFRESFTILAVLLCLVPFTRVRELPLWYRVRDSTILVLVAIIIYSPWYIRNWNTLGASFPFGTRGPINLASAYSDGAFQGAGMWSVEIANEYQPKAPGDRTGLAAELFRAQEGTSYATAWIVTNYSRVPSLIFLKLRSYLWTDLSIFYRILLFGGMLFFRWTPRPIAMSAWILVVSQALLVGLTHNVPQSRFFVPLSLPLIALVSCSAVLFWHRWVLFDRQRRSVSL